VGGWLAGWLRKIKERVRVEGFTRLAMFRVGRSGHEGLQE
jgi:hypothetical protein